MRAAHSPVSMMREPRSATALISSAAFADWPALGTDDPATELPWPSTVPWDQLAGIPCDHRRDQARSQSCSILFSASSCNAASAACRDSLSTTFMPRMVIFFLNFMPFFFLNTAFFASSVDMFFCSFLSAFCLFFMASAFSFSRSALCCRRLVLSLFFFDMSPGSSAAVDGDDGLARRLTCTQPRRLPVPRRSCLTGPRRIPPEAGSNKGECAG
mmetsp:Transcript_36225/g.92593  ORF Transcript_36225/g.92593 Transcript_36225/m.92593 type:complete len:214 (+) Transcript_36225:1-642(+)